MSDRVLNTHPLYNFAFLKRICILNLKMQFNYAADNLNMKRLLLTITLPRKMDSQQKTNNSKFSLC